MFRTTLLLAGLSLAVPTLLVAAPADGVDFNQQIKPILAKRCFSCHGPDQAEAGLRLHEAETATAELESGLRAVVAGKPEQSELLARVTSRDEFTQMPPEGGRLSDGEVDLLRRWIADGAKWDKHWSFLPLERPAVPEVSQGAWGSNPIDAFILKRLQAAGLKPNPQADKVTLIRRATFDLTGLPPTPEEVQSFLADESPDAYERLIDRLLASPTYGERWARHWLDLVRFAETNSFERDGVKPNAWRYRDYVIRSFNDDKPYDQFVREQLAGDELDEVTPETITATAYYRLGIWDDEPADRKQAYYDELDDIVSTTSQVFLGLTVNCARCHDHKIDPIPQRDYYRMMAFFHGLTSYGHRGDQRTNSQTDITSPELVAKYQALDKEQRELEEQMRPIEQAGIEKMSAPDQRRSEGREREKLLQEKLKDYLDDDRWAAYVKLRDQREDVLRRRRELPPRAATLSVANCRVPAPPAHVLLRGNAHSEGDVVEPGFPEIFEAADPQLPELPADARTNGRRKVLANWIVAPENRLTSRVIVNRVWQFHFGRGIVRSTNNFGQLGTPPTHPELLDWLATEFVRQGWKLKSLHRLIMTSQAYQMSSRGQQAGLATDPANDLFWRFDIRRLSAEEVRDATLAATGRLNLTMFGPGMYPKISAEVLQGQSRPGDGWGNSSLEERSRRSIYIHVKRSLITPLLVAFDFPDTDSSCDGRFATTQPAQALALMNGEFFQDQAAALAERLRREAGPDPAAQVERALWLTTCREPEDHEIQRGLDLMNALQAEDNLNPDQALTYYCLVALNQNEFLYVD